MAERHMTAIWLFHNREIQFVHHITDQSVNVLGETKVMYFYHYMGKDMTL